MSNLDSPYKSSEPPRTQTPPPPDAGVELPCANHPGTMTSLRCNRCGKPICTRCAILTPVGYRCRECVRGQQAVFFTATPIDYAVTLVVALPLGLLAGFLANLIGNSAFFWLLIFAGPFAGGIIADLAHRAVRRRRGRHLWLVTCAAIVLGALPYVGVELLGALLGGLSGAPLVYTGLNLLRVIFLGVYLVTAVAAAYSRLRFGK